jgi:hypothetical protein
MDLVPYLSLSTDAPINVRGVLAQATYEFAEQFGETACLVGAVNSGCRIDPAARLLSGRPSPVFADFPLASEAAGPGQWTGSTQASPGSWVLVADPNSGKMGALMDDCSDPVSFTLAQTPPAGGNPIYDGYGYTVDIVRGDPPVSASRTPSETYLIWHLGTGWKIEARYGQPFVLYQDIANNPNNPSWAEMRRSDGWEDSAAYLKSRNGRLSLTVLCYPARNTISISIGGSDIDLSYTAAALPFPSGPYMLEGRNGKVRVQFWTLGYPATWAYTSKMRRLPYAPQNPASGVQISLWPAPTNASTVGHRFFNVNPPVSQPYPNGCAATVLAVAAVADATYWNYVITCTAPATNVDGSSPFSPVLDWVSVNFPSISYTATYSMPVKVTPVRVEPHLFFDWNTLTGTAYCDITLDNSRGQNSFFSGMRAGTLTLGWQLPDGSVVSYPYLSGWFGETNEFIRADPQRLSRHRMYDMTYPLRVNACGELGWFDGWCIYAAMRFLAEAGGVMSDPTSFDWLQYVPQGTAGPCASGPNPTGCTHPQIPFTPGVRPRWQPNQSASLWSEMVRIAVRYRQVLGGDQNGYLRTGAYASNTGVPYLGSLGMAMSPALFQFQGAGTSTIAGLPYLNEFDGELRAVVSVADVRSSVSLVGRDPQDWGPLAVTDSDNYTSVVLDPTSPIHRGFPCAMVDLDPTFTDTAFMESAAALISQQCAIPTLNVDFGAIFQPNLFLHQTVDVFDPLVLGIAPITCQVMGIDGDFGLDPHTKRTVCKCRIMAKSVVNW